MKKVLDGKIFDMTAEEIAERNADVEKAKIEREQEEKEKTNAATKKASGKQKLLDLGLSEEEVKALIGV